MPGVIGRWVVLAALVAVIWPPAAHATRVLRGETTTGYRVNLTLATGGAPEKMTFAWTAPCRRTRATLRDATVMRPRVANSTPQAFHVSGAYRFGVRGGYQIRVGIAAHGTAFGPDEWHGKIDINAVVRRHGRPYDRCRHRALGWIATGPQPRPQTPAPAPPSQPPPPSGPTLTCCYDESPKAGAWSLAMHSDPGDPVGFGSLPDHSYGPPKDTLEINTSQHYSVGFRVSGSDGTGFFGRLWAPEGQDLAVGTYSGVQETRNPQHGGLMVFSNGRGCTHTTGSFTVSELAWDTTGTLQTFKGSFEQHCDGSVPALHGTLEFHAAAPATRWAASRLRSSRPRRRA